MPLKIRLSRGGAKKRPFYRIVVADSRMPRDGRFIEKIGTFDPLKAKDDASRLALDQEKAKAWLVKGAQPTDRVLRLLDSLGLMKREARNNPNKAKPRKKAQERAAAAEAAAAKAAEAPPRPDADADPCAAPDRLVLDGHVRRAAGRGGRNPREILHRRSGRDRRLWRADRSQARAQLRLRAGAPAEGRHARRQGEGRFDSRDAAAALTGTEFFARREPIAAARRGRVLLCRSRRARGRDARAASRSGASPAHELRRRRHSGDCAGRRRRNATLALHQGRRARDRFRRRADRDRAAARPRRGGSVACVAGGCSGEEAVDSCASS